jgi:putative ATPase
MARTTPTLFDRHATPGAGAAGNDPFAPLAERMRPRTLDELVGQQHLLAPGRPLRRAIEAGRVPSMILWGPPGTGKTTLARLLATTCRAAFESLSAVTSGVKDLREVVERARERRADGGGATMLFLDEIHRFNRAQQDALLPHVESGLLRLTGATTENPSFEVNAALLSRARVFALRELTIDDLAALLERALGDRERGLGDRGITADPKLLRALAAGAAGDARRALGDLEACVDLLPDEATTLDAEWAGRALGRRALRYDKAGEEHYNVVSAFIKSMRASDPDAAVYWLVRMLEAGEDAMFVARRIVIFASEDIGNADPGALSVATAAASATHLVGMPEAALHLTQATLYLSLAPKSNSALTSYAAARKEVQRSGALPVPMSIRNAVTAMMKAAGYGSGYRYPHDFPEGVERGRGSLLPDTLAAARLELAKIGDIGWEAEARRRLDALTGDPPQAGSQRDALVLGDDAAMATAAGGPSLGGDGESPHEGATSSSAPGRSCAGECEP